MADAAPRSCSVAAALGVIGEKWSLLVIRELAWGVHRFDAIARNTGAPRDILTSRLRRLEAAGVLEKRRYQERPPRFDYHLTPAGHELRLVHTCRACGEEVTGFDLKARILTPGRSAAA